MKELNDFKNSVNVQLQNKFVLFLKTIEIVKKIGPTIVSQKMGKHRSYVSKTLNKNISDENLIAIAEVLEEMENGQTE